MMAEPQEIFNQGYQEGVQAAQQQGFFSQANEDDDIVTKWQLSTERQLQQLEQYLSGKVWDDEKRGYVQIKGVEPLMNARGIRYTLFVMRGVLDKNTGLSDISTEKCNEITRSLSLAYLKNVFLKMNDYELRKVNLGAIVRIFKENTYLLLSRAVEGGEREIIKTVRKEFFAVKQDDQPRKKSGLTSLMPSSWGGNQI